MTLTDYLITIGLSIAPISELRGAIPFAVARGSNLFLAAAIAFLANACVPLIVYAFLDTAHKLLYKWKFYAGVFDRFVAKTRVKVHAGVEKYGYWGLLIFVAIPLPMTGAWTGALGGWILGMDRKKTALAVIGGVFVAAVVVTLVVGLGIGALSIFVKKI
jgi:uncharacterized membrane protein